MSVYLNTQVQRILFYSQYSVAALWEQCEQ